MQLRKNKETKTGVQGARWRRLDNTGKLFAAVAGEDLSNVFRISAVLKENIRPELLEEALDITLLEFDNFRVKLRKGFFWYYFETNNRQPLVEREEGFPCRYIDPHGSRRFLFRVSYYGKRINFEVFHGLTDGLGALNFIKVLTEHYLELAPGEKQTEKEEIEKESSAVIRMPAEERETDGYLKNYRKRSVRRYASRKALPIKGACMPLNGQSVIHGTLKLTQLKEQSHNYGVSITVYLASVLIWSLLRIYGNGAELKYPAALNLPVNLRTIFDTETQANFFSITNVCWPAGKAPERFEDVLETVSRQLKEQTVKERLEEVISYNVSNEKKWYVRITPLFVKHMVLDALFRRSSRAHSMTFSNLGPVTLRPELSEAVEEFRLSIGVSRRQRVKCGAVAYGENVSITFTSVMADSRLSDYFFGFLEKQGLSVCLESNGAARPDLDRGTYPAPEYDQNKLKRFSGLFYLVLLTLAAVIGVINYMTYRINETWWSFLTIGAIAYVALIVRYSLMRKASLAGNLLRHSVGIQILLIIFDWLNGFAGWSVNYVIPSLILFDVTAIIFLILVNRMNWQSYFMYQLAVTVLSFIPLLLWAVGLVTRPFMSIIAVIISVAVLAVTMLLGDRSVKTELKRRFHL
ncbi:MAG: MFS transporter [Clostridium sp.]|nr:MFS transporter [Clostridium sp.]